MNARDSFELEMQETLSVRVEEPAPTERNSICSRLRRIVNLDDVPNQKHYRPVFVIVMCLLHISIYLSTYINIRWRGQKFMFNLLDLFRFFVPCMRPTPDNIRILLVTCHPSVQNKTCSYDDELKKMCFTFMYPHQLWRMLTVNLLHINWFHLVANLLQQLLYGIPLERKYGSARIAAIYWLAELSSSLCFMLKNREKGK
jgi:membrane associated rhomboid family serine protease